jgi:hypothetical protein
VVTAIEHSELATVLKYLHQTNVALFVVSLDVLLKVLLFLQCLPLLLSCVCTVWVDELAIVAKAAPAHQIVLTDNIGLLLF